jgi:site-specific DNA-cytosine methylase
MKTKTNLLKPYEFNKEFFDDIQGTDYDALKEDIRQNGIKVELHITKSNVILCGHQRWNIAKEIGLKEVPVKVVKIDEKDERKVKEYVIKDNLLRRHLLPEQKYILIATLSEVYEVGRGGDRVSKDAKVASLVNEPQDDVLTKTAKDTGVGERTVARARQYKELIKKSPELKTKKVTEVLNKYEIKQDKVVRKNTRIEIDMNKLNPYDTNMFHFSNTYELPKSKKITDRTLCIDVTHGEDDIRVYNDYYPTVLHVCCFVDKHGRELSLRKYAEIQDFPKDYKFVGTSQEIKRQIGEAVSPRMGEYILKKYIKGKKYIELFSGCGGFSVAGHKLKKECLWCNDFNKYSGHSFKLNFPDTEVFIGDIIDIDEKKIHKEIGDIDFIMGGPPCQGFSSAGKRLGFKEDSRNSLYLDFLRFVQEFKPKQFIMENVKEIENYKEEIIKDFEEIGYSIIVEKVNGLDIGMKQKRVRVFFIGEIKEVQNARGESNTSRTS